MFGGLRAVQQIVNKCVARFVPSWGGLDVMRDGKAEDVTIQSEKNRRHWAPLADPSLLQVRCTSVPVDGRVVTGGAVEAANEVYEGRWVALMFRGAGEGPVGYAVKSLVEVYVKAVRCRAVLVLSKDLENVSRATDVG